MAASLRIPLGAPGIYRLPEEPVRALTGVRMDVCAFVGVAPRGPAREPVVNESWPADRPFVEPERPRRRTVALAVESFDEYRRLYGGFEGPGLLPYAVAAFFEQGGRRAYVARMVHEGGSGTAASGTVGGVTSPAGEVRLSARNEGSWGNGLTAAMTFTRTPAPFEEATLTSVSFPDDFVQPAGSKVECRLPSGARELRTLTAIVRQGHADRAGYARVATLDSVLPDVPEALEILEGTLVLDDGDGRRELHDRLGLSALHPRWAATVLSNESELALPDAAWANLEIAPDDTVVSAPFEGGTDAYEEIVPDDFFDASWTLGDDEPGSGVHCLTQISDLSLLVVPDLYSPFPLVPQEAILDPPSLAGPEFERCFDRPAAGEQAHPVADLEGLRLDPRIPAELEQISALQARLEEFAALMQSFVVLLDVPPGLSQRQMLRWRAPFRSAYAAAYHPWLQVARRDDSRDALVRVPPSAVAAGIIARSEILFGVPHGPANALASEVVNVEDAVSGPRHDELHQQAINVYLRERDGIRLTAARTLSRDPAYRQLSVRRLITMMRRTLEQQTQWLVFEPNTPSLRADVRKMLSGFLRQLLRAGAFRGATEEESFFVRCDETLNTPLEQDAGRLIAEIGVAPAEPIEFIVLRLSREADGTLTVRE